MNIQYGDKPNGLNFQNDAKPRQWRSAGNLLHSAKNAAHSKTANEPGYAVKRARKCQEKRREIEQTHQDSTHDWLANDVFPTILAFDSDRGEYQRFGKEEFFRTNYSKGLPSPKDKPDKIIRCVSRFVWGATDTKGGRYDTAMRYARILHKLYVMKVFDPAEVRAKLKKRACHDFFDDLAAEPQENHPSNKADSKQLQRSSSQPSRNRLSIDLSPKQNARIRNKPAGSLVRLTMKIDDAGKLRVLKLETRSRRRAKKHAS